MTEHHARLTWCATGAAVAVALCVFTLFPLGMHIGMRDARLLQQADRHAAITRCAQQDKLAVRVVRDAPLHDSWICVGGSARMLRQVQP